MGGQVLNNTQVQMIAVAEIDFGQRLRNPDAAAVESLAADIKWRGLRSPIEVAKSNGKAGGYVLVAGAHRLAAVLALKWDEVAAFVVSDCASDRRRDEILENLVGSDLSALDRSVFVHEWKTLYEAINEGKTTGWGGVRPTKGGQVGTMPTWSAVIGQRTGLSERTLKRILVIGERLTSDARKVLEFTPLAHSQKELLELCSIGGEAQVMIAKHIAAGQSASVKDARQALTPTADNGEAPADPALATLLRAWSKASETTRKDFLVQIGAAFIQGGAS